VRRVGVAEAVPDGPGRAARRGWSGFCPL